MQPVFKVVEVVLVQCILEHNQYQQKSEVLYTFTSNMYLAYILNVEPRNFVFLKTLESIIAFICFWKVS